MKFLDLHYKFWLSLMLKLRSYTVLLLVVWMMQDFHFFGSCFVPLQKSTALEFSQPPSVMISMDDLQTKTNTYTDNLSEYM